MTKNKWIGFLLAAALMLSFVTAACGGSDSTPDETAAKTAPDGTVSVRSLEISQDETPVKPKQEKQEDASDAGSSRDGASSELTDEASSGVSSAVSSGSQDATAAPNPAYQDDDRPVYTISVTDTSDSKKTFSASCSYAAEDEEYAFVSFFLPGGEYKAAVYEYSESKDKGDPIATGTFKNDIPAEKRVSIRVKYTPSTGKLEVLEVKSNRNQ